MSKGPDVLPQGENLEHRRKEVWKKPAAGEEIIEDRHGFND